MTEEQDGVTLSVLRDLTKHYIEERIEDTPVLLLELAEGEVNPRSYIPALVQLCNRNVEGITKEFQKSGATYMLVNPPTCEDLCAMACMEARFGSEDSVFQGMQPEDIVRVVSERVSIVGPVLRSVLVTEDVFARRVSQLALDIPCYRLLCQSGEGVRYRASLVGLAPCASCRIILLCS